MEFQLLRILKGRLVFRRGDLSLYIYEPTQELMYDSMEIYEDAFDNAYGNGVYLKDEIEEYIMMNDFWSPIDDDEVKKIKKKIDELKHTAFKNFIKKRELAGIKFLIRQQESQLAKLLHKKSQFDHLTCEGVASYARWNWLIEQSTYFKDNTPYDWAAVNLNTVVSFYESSALTSTEFRAIARSDQWRPMWNLGKKTGNLFAKPPCELTKDQVLLCSFSSMYDVVYESSESPDEDVIADDDCLDGWFIDQKRKTEKMKKEQQVNSMLSNPKIANAGEVFLVANNNQEAEAINSVNTTQSDNIRKHRIQQVSEKGIVDSDLVFGDVKRDLQMQQNQALVDHLKGR